MARVAPFHDVQHPEVYHVCSTCPEANNVKARHKKPGRARGKLCNTCMLLSSRGKC